MQRRLTALLRVTVVLLSLLLWNVTSAYAAKSESPAVSCGAGCNPAEAQQLDHFVYLPGIVRGAEPSSPHTVVDPSADWTAEWWQWAEKLNNVPITEEGTVDCTNGQVGSVWFLAGTQGGPAVVRSCSVPSDKTLLAPLYTADYFNDPSESLTVQEKRAVLDSLFSDTEPGPLNSQICHLESSIDGVAVNYTRLQSPPFLSQGDPEVVSDGFWFAFTLSPGTHQVHFHGALCTYQTEDEFSSVDVTYNLAVEENLNETPPIDPCPDRILDNPDILGCG